MRILIDGYNLIRRVPELAFLEGESLEQGREVLLKFLSGYAWASRNSLKVVFDGTASPRPGGGSGKVLGVSVVYSPRGMTADDLIAEMTSKGEADLLVTADRGLASRSGGRVGVVSPEEFWERVRRKAAEKAKGGEEEERAPASRPGKKLPKRIRKVLRQREKL